MPCLSKQPVLYRIEFTAKIFRAMSQALPLYFEINPVDKEIRKLR